MKKRSKPIYAIAILSFGIALAEGYLYFSEYLHFGVFQFLLILQNAISAFLFNPKIGIENVLETIDPAMSSAQRMIPYAYILAVFAAPICTATAAFQTIQRFLRKGLSHRHSKSGEETLVLGYGAKVAGILKNSTAEELRSVVLMEKEAIDETTELQYLRQGVCILHGDFPSLAPEEQLALLARAGGKRISRVIICDEDDVQNLAIYLSLRNQAGALKQDARILCCCEAPEIARLLLDAHDESGQRLDLQLFSLAELRVRETLARYPLWTSNLLNPAQAQIPLDASRWDVHMLIVGFGSVGEQFLRQAMNLSVMHSHSRIIFDVVDCNMKEKRDQFQSCFSNRYISEIPDGIQISGDRADGLLQIRFHEMRANGAKLTQLLKRIEQDCPLTYAAICVTDSQTGIHCVRTLEHAMSGKGESRMPIVVRLDTSVPLADYFEGNKSVFRNVFPVVVQQKILSMETLFHQKADQASKAFHASYQEMNAAVTQSPKTAEDSWASLEAFRKQSSRSMEDHQRVKEMLRSKAGELYSAPRLKAELCAVLGTNWREQQLTAAELVRRINAQPLVREMAMLEHRRWCYFMALDGWCHAREQKTADNQATQHRCMENYCLTNWDTLCRENPSVCLYDLIPYLSGCE